MSAQLSKNQQALRLVLQECGQSLGRTRLQKVFFLADYEARRRLGRPITSYEYKFWKKGPFTAQIFEDVESLEALGMVKAHFNPTRWGRPSHYYSIPSGQRLDRTELGPDDALLLVATARQCAQGRKSIDELLDEVYDTPPMRLAQRQGRGVRIPMEMFDASDPATVGVNLDRIERSEREFARGEGRDLREVLNELQTAHFPDSTTKPY